MLTDQEYREKIRPKDGLPASRIDEPGNWPDGRLYYSDAEIAALKAAGLDDEALAQLPREGRERTMQEREISALKKWGIALDADGKIVRDETGRAEIAAPLTQHPPPLASPRPRTNFTAAGMGPHTIWTKLHEQVPLLMQDTPEARDALAHGAVLRPVRVMRDGVQVTVMRAEYPDTDAEARRVYGPEWDLKSATTTQIVTVHVRPGMKLRPEYAAAAAAAGIEVRDGIAVTGGHFDRKIATIGACAESSPLPSQAQVARWKAGDDRRKCAAFVRKGEGAIREVGPGGLWKTHKPEKAKPAADPARAPRRERTDEEKAQAARVRALQQQKAAIDLARGAEIEKRLASDAARIRAASIAAMSAPADGAPREDATVGEIAERNAREAARKAAREAARKAAAPETVSDRVIVEKGKVLVALPEDDIACMRRTTEERHADLSRMRAEAPGATLCDAKRAPVRGIVVF